MTTIKVRIEPSKRNTKTASIYYRLYRGHARRYEFASGLRIPVDSWDYEKKEVRGDTEELCAVNEKIAADLKRLQDIIEMFDSQKAAYTMGDVIIAFKKQQKKE